MADLRHLLKQQIKGHLDSRTEALEIEIAQALNKKDRACLSLEAETLGPVISNIIHTVVGQQKLAGFSLPLIHNVVAAVQIQDGKMAVDAMIHLHSPVRGFTELSYTLINNPAEKTVAIIPKSLRLKTKTAPFDVVAKLAFTTMDVPRIARRQLADLARVIALTLPQQLKTRGYEGTIRNAELEITSHNTMQITLERG